MKNRKHFKKLLCFMMAAAMLLSVSVPALAAESSAEDERIPMKVEKLEDESGIQRREDRKLRDPVPEDVVANPDEVVRVSIVLEEPSTVAMGYSTIDIAADADAMRYRDALQARQDAVQTAIEKDVLDGQPLDVVWNLTLATNLISANVKRSEIAGIEDVDGVKSVFVERRYSPDVISVGGEKDPDMAVSTDMTHTNNVWSTGLTGAGTRIAIIDTGIAVDHRSFDEDAFLASLVSKGFDPSLLMTEKDIEAVLTELNSCKNSGATLDELYFNAKIPYGWCYVDEDNDITHAKDTEGEHGSHVAGIAAANRLVKDGENFVDAIEAVGMQGNAPDAQLLIMKVFGNGGGAYDSDCVAAIEDAILMNANTVNLSLGSPLPGFSAPITADDPYVELLKTLKNTDTVVVFSAGNAGAWADESAPGGLYNDGVSFSMGGESGSYTDSFTVASVDNDGMVSPTIQVGSDKFYFTDTGITYNAPAFTSLDTAGTGTQYDYIMLSANSAGSELEALQALKSQNLISSFENQIVVLHRGGSSFYVKGNAGAAVGAKAVIVANNQPGTISMDLTGYIGHIPVVSILQSDGQALFAAGKEEEPESFTYTYTPEGGQETPVTAQYVTGKLTVNAKVEVTDYKSNYFTMSEFSSWGITGALELKPEITAPGGNIWSVNGLASPDGYELMSGTSMAAPQITGIGALVQQSLASRGYQGDMNNRALTMALMMSTATPLKDADGHYYSLLQQGAGLVNANAAVITPGFLTVNGRDDGKVKVELGEDIEKKGEYTFEFTVHNLTASTMYYSFDADMFTQDSQGGYLLGSTKGVDAKVEFYVDGVKLAAKGIDKKYDFNKDGNVDRADADLLLESIVNGDPLENGKVDEDDDVDTHDVSALLAMGQAYAAVPGKGSVTVKAVITGFELDEDNYPVGGYVEGFVTATAMSSIEGLKYPDLSLPILGYYGSWTEPSMYEIGTGDEWWDAFQTGTMSVGDRYPYTAPTIFTGQGNDGLTNIILEDDNYIYVDGDSIGNITGALQYRYTPIRNSGNGMTQITYEDENGTHVLWRSEDNGPEYGVTYYESSALWLRPDTQGRLYYSLFNVADVDLAAAIEAIPEGVTVDEITISVVRAPEYYADANGKYDWDALTDGDNANGELGEGAFLSTTLILDLEEPEIISASYSNDEDDDGNMHIFAEVVDNNSVIDITLWGDAGDALAYEYNPGVYSSLSDYLDDIPNFTPTAPNEPYTAEFDGYYSGSYVSYGILDTRVDTLTDDVYIIQVTDVAGNVSTFRLSTMGDAEIATGVTVDADSLEMVVGSTAQLSAKAEPKNLLDRTVSWKSEDDSVATVDDTGLVTAVGKGETNIVVTANASPEGEPVTVKVPVTVFTIPVTAHGILGDAEGYAKVFTWNFDEGKLTYNEGDEDETVYPTATTRYSDNTILTVDGNGYIHQLPADGVGDELKVSEVPVYSEDYEGLLPFDMTWSQKSGFSTTMYNFLVPGDDPFNPQFLGFNLSQYAATYGNTYTIAAVDKPWTSGANSGEYVIYALTDAGYMWKFMIYNQGQSASMSIFPLRSTGFDWSFDGFVHPDNGLLPYSNMVIGEDGAFYISIMRNDTNEVVRLELEEGADNSFSYSITPMGDFGEGVWPGLFLDVEDVNTEVPDAGNTVYGEAQAVIVGTVEAQSMKSVIEPETTEPDTQLVVDGSATMEPLPLTGSLNGISSGETGTAGGGIKVDTGKRTVTVPVVADATTNGLVKLTYDSEVLTFQSVNDSTILMRSRHDADNHEIIIAFADGATIEGEVVASVVFTYKASYSSQTAAFDMTVEEDGEAKGPEIDEEQQPEIPEVKIPALTPPTTPVEPDEPDVPDVPDEPSDPGKEEDTPVKVPETFEDLSSEQWYFEYVKEMLADGYLGGVSETRFAPETFLERGMAAVIFHRIEKEPEVTDPAAFTDVATTDYFAKAVDWASSVKVILGVSDDLYEPTRNVTRQELIVMLWRYAQLQGYDVRTDGTVIPEAIVDRDSIAPWANEAVCWAYREGILLGKDGNRLDPEGEITRAETCAVFSRFLALDPAKDKADA